MLELVDPALVDTAGPVERSGVEPKPVWPAGDAWQAVASRSARVLRVPTGRTVAQIRPGIQGAAVCATGRMSAVQWVEAMAAASCAPVCSGPPTQRTTPWRSSTKVIGISRTLKRAARIPSRSRTTGNESP